MHRDGTPVQDEMHKVVIKKDYQGKQPSQNLIEEHTPVDGVAPFDVEIPDGCTSLKITVSC